MKTKRLNIQILRKYILRDKNPLFICDGELFSFFDYEEKMTVERYNYNVIATLNLVSVNFYEDAEDDGRIHKSITFTDAVEKNNEVLIITSNENLDDLIPFFKTSN